MSETYILGVDRVRKCDANEWGKTSKLKIRMLTHSYPKLSFDIELAASYRLFIITGANSSMIPVGSQSYLVRIRSSAWDH